MSLAYRSSKFVSVKIFFFANTIFMDVEKYLRERRSLIRADREYAKPSPENHPHSQKDEKPVTTISCIQTAGTDSDCDTCMSERSINAIENKVDPLLIDLDEMIRYVENIAGLIYEEGYTSHERTILEENRISCISEDAHSTRLRNMANIVLSERHRMIDEDNGCRRYSEFITSFKTREIRLLANEETLVKNASKATLAETTDMIVEDGQTRRLLHIGDAERDGLEKCYIESLEYRALCLEERSAMRSIEQKQRNMFISMIYYATKIQAYWRSRLAVKRFQRLLLVVDTIQTLGKIRLDKPSIPQLGRKLVTELNRLENEEFMRSILALDYDYLTTCDHLVEMIDVMDSFVDYARNFQDIIESEQRGNSPSRTVNISLQSANPILEIPHLCDDIPRDEMHSTEFQILSRYTRGRLGKLRRNNLGNRCSQWY